MKSDGLAFEVQAEVLHPESCLLGFVRQPGEPVDIPRRRSGFVDHTARYQDEVTAMRLRRLDDPQVAAVRVHSDQEIEFRRHRRFERAVQSGDRFADLNADSPARLGISEFGWKGLAIRVDDGSIPSAFPEQVGEQALAAAYVGNPAWIERSDQPVVQELETKPLQLRQLLTGLSS